jgi:hypothetical protein
MEPSTPFGASIPSLATDLCDTHAISEGALANLFQRVHTQLDDRVTEILTRLRSNRLIGRDETGARVNGRPQ